MVLNLLFLINLRKFSNIDLLVGLDKKVSEEILLTISFFPRLKFIY